MKIFILMAALVLIPQFSHGEAISAGQGLSLYSAPEMNEGDAPLVVDQKELKLDWRDLRVELLRF